MGGVDEDFPFLPMDVISVAQIHDEDWRTCRQYVQLRGGSLVEISIEEFNLLLTVFGNGLSMEPCRLYGTFDRLFFGHVYVIWLSQRERQEIERLYGFKPSIPRLWQWVYERANEKALIA